MSKPAERMEFITPPNLLTGKLGGVMPRLDADAVARAEEALKSLASQFDGWMDEELEKLEAAWAEARAAKLKGEAGANLFRAGHDVKGLGTTYEFPLVTRLATPLCKLIETEELRSKARVDLVGALIEAIAVAIRDRVRSDDHPVGRALAQESEKIVARMLRDLED
jgi:chemotaxis protein histidine kinase CheA